MSYTFVYFPPDFPRELWSVVECVCVSCEVTMDNMANIQPSGEEIERALMDLGPLLGVSIKEEVAEELPDAVITPMSNTNVRLILYY